MPQYFSVGSALLSQNELTQNMKGINKFLDDLDKNKKPDDLLLPTGMLGLSTINSPKVKGKPVPFEPIGMGLPLRILLRTVYTGKHPEGNFFGKKKGLLVTSSIKSYATYNAQPQALNVLKESVGPRCVINGPGGDEVGTPIMFYSPAVVDESLIITLRFVFDNFPAELFSEVGKFFKSAATIPIFLTNSLYLMVAGEIVNLAGKVGERVFDGQAAFDHSEPLSIWLPGKKPAIAGFALIFDDDVDLAFRKKYRVNPRGEVVDKDGNVYAEDNPYVVISYDGKANDDLKSFAPTAASAEILSRFFGQSTNGDSELLLDALQLYNDAHFRKKIEELDEKIKKTKDAATKKQLKEQRAAFEANIGNELLKPK